MNNVFTQLVLPLGFFILLLWKCVSLIATFRRNLTLAQSTGLPYVLSPLHPWDISSRIVVPLLRAVVGLLPLGLRQYFSVLDHLGSDPFVMNRNGELYPDGGKSYLIVAPSNDNLLVTRDSHLVSQLYARKNEFEKPLEDYRAISVFGHNVVTVDGDQWRQHLRVVGPLFNARNNALVWSETIDVAQKMLRDWVGKTECGLPISTLNQDVERLALFVIAVAGFGVSMHWPSELGHGYREPTWTKPHKLNFDTTMQIVNTQLITILFVPHWILQFAPWRAFNRIYEGVKEFRSYLLDILEDERAKMLANKKPGADLVRNIIRASYADNKTHLSEDEIFGNTFAMIVAGHETTAHTMEYAIIKLAQNPRLVMELQEAIEKRFASKRSFSDWKYPEDFDNFEEAIALMYETLRLYPIATAIPKRSRKDVPPPSLRTSESDWRQVTLPPGTKINIDLVNVHRNVENWGPDATVFRPSRWIVENAHSAAKINELGGGLGAEGANQESATNLTSNARIYRPPKGHFLPFSEGSRACLGRKFSLVEFTALFGVLFRDCGVELDLYHDNVGNEQRWILDEDIARFGGAEATRMAYERKSEDVEGILNKSTSVITMKPPGNISLRWVPKGQEIWRKWLN